MHSRAHTPTPTLACMHTCIHLGDRHHLPQHQARLLPAVEPTQLAHHCALPAALADYDQRSGAQGRTVLPRDRGWRVTAGQQRQGRDQRRGEATARARRARQGVQELL